MIVPDVNLLVYAHNAESPQHEAARSWWERSLSGTEPVAIPWLAVLGYVRLVTSRAVLVDPITPAAALGHVRSWLARPNVQILVPGPRHLDLLEQMLAGTGGSGTLTTDAHLAALAIENQASLCSNDADFARFPGLNWVNPLAR